MKPFKQFMNEATITEADTSELFAQYIKLSKELDKLEKKEETTSKEDKRMEALLDDHTAVYDKMLDMKIPTKEMRDAINKNVPEKYKI